MRRESAQHVNQVLMGGKGMTTEGTSHPCSDIQEPYTELFEKSGRNGVRHAEKSARARRRGQLQRFEKARLAD